MGTQGRGLREHSSNGLKPWSGLPERDNEKVPRADRLEEIDQRNIAAVAWIQSAFVMAKERDAKAVVIMTHANMLSQKKRNRFGEQEPFRDDMAPLLDQVVEFERPILLIHGD